MTLRELAECSESLLFALKVPEVLEEQVVAVLLTGAGI